MTKRKTKQATHSATESLNHSLFVPGCSGIWQSETGKQPYIMAAAAQLLEHLKSEQAKKYVFLVETEDGLKVSFRDVGNFKTDEKDMDPMATIKSDSEMPRCVRSQTPILIEIRSSLRPNETATRVGVSRMTITKYRRDGLLLGILQGRNRYVYPAWQLDRAGQPIPILKEIIEVLSLVTTDPVEILDLMIGQREFLGGDSIKDRLISGDTKGALVAAKQSAGF